MQYRKFQELLRQAKKDSSQQQQAQIFILSEKNGQKIKKYNSYSDLKAERYLKQQS